MNFLVDAIVLWNVHNTGNSSEICHFVTRRYLYTEAVLGSQNEFSKKHQVLASFHSVHAVVTQKCGQHTLLLQHCKLLPCNSVHVWDKLIMLSCIMYSTFSQHCVHNRLRLFSTKKITFIHIIAKKKLLNRFSSKNRAAGT